MRSPAASSVRRKTHKRDSVLLGPRYQHSLLWVRSIARLGTLAMVAAAAASCTASGPPRSSGTIAGRQSGASKSVSTPGATITAPVASSPPSSASATPQSCRSQQLSARFAKADVAASNQESDLIVVQNSSQVACLLSGYPVVTGLNADGKTLPGSVADVHSTDWFQGLIPASYPTTLASILQPSGAAFFGITWGDANPIGSGSTPTECYQVNAMTLTAPGDQQPVSVSTALVAPTTSLSWPPNMVYCILQGQPFPPAFRVSSYLSGPPPGLSPQQW